MSYQTTPCYFKIDKMWLSFVSKKIISHVRDNPSKHLRLLEPRNQSINAFELHKIRGSNDFEASRLWNVRSGREPRTNCHIMSRRIRIEFWNSWRQTEANNLSKRMKLNHCKFSWKEKMKLRRKKKGDRQDKILGDERYMRRRWE